VSGHGALALIATSLNYKHGARELTDFRCVDTKPYSHHGGCRPSGKLFAAFQKLASKFDAETQAGLFAGNAKKAYRA
jgi:hypothetical protein